MSTCQSWCAAVLADPELIPEVSLEVPALWCEASAAEVTEYCRQVEAFQCAAADMEPRSAVKVILWADARANLPVVQVAAPAAAEACMPQACLPVT